MNKIREDYELPPVVVREGWRYHHIGIPTQQESKNEVYIEKYKMYVSGFSSSPYGIEFMRFEEGSCINELIKKVPHVAFVVDNIEEAIKDRELIDGISSPAKGVRVAMIKDNGAPIEVMEFGNNSI